MHGLNFGVFYLDDNHVGSADENNHVAHLTEASNRLQE